MQEIHGITLWRAALFACSLFTVVSATALATSSTDQNPSRTVAGIATPVSRSSIHSMRRIVDELRRLADKTRYLQEDAYRLVLLQNAKNIKDDEDDNIDGDVVDTVDYARAGSQSKRTGGSWDMDYGWGGGRFGKRRDRLSLAGRFGRSIREGANEE